MYQQWYDVVVPIALPPLPYEFGALAPYMSAQTLRYHYEGNHAKYVRRTNEMIRGSALENASLLEIVKVAERERERSRPSAIFRNRASWDRLFDQASQAWTHTMFWYSMCPGGTRPQPNGPLGPLFRQANDALYEEALQLFGSGWVWVVDDDGRLRIVATPNAERPAGNPLLVCDLWEHAYIYDYPVDRAAYVRTWLDHLANWAFAERMLAGEIPPELR